MGRGRGKGKKTVVTTHEDPESGGEEVVPAYRRRGRPTKPLKEDFDEEDAEKVEGEGDDIKPMASSKEAKSSVENGKKRRRHSQVKESSNSVLLEENGSLVQVSNDESIRSNGFRANGRRRKSKPRRAAEAGVECKLSDCIYMAETMKGYSRALMPP